MVLGGWEAAPAGVEAIGDGAEGGESAGAADVYYRDILLLLRIVTAAGGQGEGGGTMIWAHTELLRRAGVLRTAYCRAAVQPLPEARLHRALSHIERGDLLIGRRTRSR